MFVLRLFGRGLQRPGNAGGGKVPMDLIAQRAMPGRHVGRCPIDYANLGWLAEQSGAVKQALAIYELLAHRPGAAARWVYERMAATALAQHQYALAIESYETLSARYPEDASALLILGHLLLLDGWHAEACGVLERGMELLVLEGDMMQADAVLECLEGAEPVVGAPAGAAAPPRPGVSRVQNLAQRGLSYLQRGRFVRATELFEDAMGLVDSLLVAQGQWLLAQAKADAGALPQHLVEALISLAQLADMLLQQLARTKLAANLATALRQRQLRYDLASWATGAHEVHQLLLTEKSRLTELAKLHPNHAELHYRIGICERANGNLPAATTAFRQVLAIAPHHAKTGARLAATLLQAGRADEALRVLERTMALADDEAQQFYSLGVAAADSQKFDRAMAALARDLGVEFAADDDRANLAFALGMLGIKDAQTDEWKECGLQECGAGA